jgi:PAS domain S-box-containing protein
MEKAKILIVEDEAIIAMEIESQLQSLGYEVTSIVETGEKAIAKAEEDKPDLMLMDIRIKGEMDGIDTAEVIRNKFSIPVIFSSAYLDQERIERAKITMPFGYVLKPIQERDLRVTLEMALYIAKADVERKKVGEESQRSEELLNATQEMAKIGGWEIDLERQVTYWTDELYRIHDLQTDKFTAIDENDDGQGQNLKSDEFTSVDEAVKLSVECYAPEDQQRLTDAFKDCQEKAQAYDFELPFTSMKGHQKWIRTITAPVIENNKVVKIKGFLQDITDRRQAEEALKKSEEWFSTTLKSIGDAVITTDISGNITLLNPVAETLTGWNQEEAKGKPLKEVFNIINETTRKPVDNPVEKVLTTGNIVGLANHTILIAKDGKEIPIDDSGSPIKNDKGEVFGVVLVFREIAKNK